MRDSTDASRQSGGRWGKRRGRERMKHVVRGVLFGLLIGAVAGGIPFGLIGMLSTLSSGHGEPIWMVGLFGFAVAGFYGAIPGGVLGGIVGLIVGLIRRAAADRPPAYPVAVARSEEHTSELQSRGHLVCRLML